MNAGDVCVDDIEVCKVDGDVQRHFQETINPIQNKAPQAADCGCAQTQGIFFSVYTYTMASSQS